MAVVLALTLAVIALPSAAAEEPGLVIVTSKLDLTGNWRLTLTYENNVTGYVNLTLHQAEREVFGRGSLTTENITRRVLADGFLERDLLNLYLITEEGDFMLRLYFEVIDDDFMSGNYRVYSSDGSEKIGSGSGSMYISNGTAFGIYPGDLIDPSESPKIDCNNIAYSINLTLHLAESQVFGHGNITNYNETLKVVAGGFLEGENLNLYLIPEGMDFMFMLDYSGFSLEEAERSGCGLTFITISDLIPIRRIMIQTEESPR